MQPFDSWRQVATLAIAGMLFGIVLADAAEKPNVVVILTDDQGWGDLSVNGNRNLSTPNIDSLARDGNCALGDDAVGIRVCQLLFVHRPSQLR